MMQAGSTADRRRSSSGVRAVIVGKSCWEKWTVSDGFKDGEGWGSCGILRRRGVRAGDCQELVNVGPAVGLSIDFCGHCDLPLSGCLPARTEGWLGSALPGLTRGPCHTKVKSS